MKWRKKTSARAEVVLFIVLLFIFLFIAAFLIAKVDQERTQPPAIGVTFSTAYAKSLGLDWQETFMALIQDLGVNYMRIPIYWSEVEYRDDTYYWGEVDWMLWQAEHNNVHVTLVVGMKTPRWPECHIPEWAEALENEKMQRKVLEHVEATVTRYKHHPAVGRWQVENEAFFPFGVCPAPDPDLFTKEIELVRTLDNTRPIQLTASGEAELWVDTASMGDILGISLYRTTWNRLFGFFTYPFGPGVYRERIRAVRPFVQKVVISELQAEPWFSEAIENRNADEWALAFTPETLTNHLEFARQTGVAEVYLWGAEWWYFLKKNGRPELWETVKNYSASPVE